MMSNVLSTRRLLLAFIGVLPLSTLSGCAAGYRATTANDAGELRQIVDQPNFGNEDPWHLEVEAIRLDCPACLKVLLDKGAYTNANALAYAAFLGRSKAANVLIDHGVEIADAMAAIQQQGVMGYAPSPAMTQSTSAFFDRIERERDRASRVAPPTAPPAPAASETSQESREKPIFRQAERPDDYALIVGIEKYDDLPPATYAERDAAAATDFVGALGVPARNIVTLTGAHATRSGLAKKLEGWLANNADGKSTVYFYYSGHGAPNPSTGQAYLVPFDGDPEYLEQTGYPLKRLYEKLGALKAKRVVVMLDSCFSGAGGRSVLAKGARPLVSKIDTGFDSTGKIAVLSASGADQISGTKDEKGHGLFSYYLFDGLNGAAKDSSGEVTLKSLFDYVKPKVMDDAHRANRDQIPQLQTGGSAGGVVLRDR